MIDIHAHIIPDVDDGASSMEESLKMLKIAEQDGVKAMAATPHIFSQMSKLESTAELHQRFEELKKELAHHRMGIEIVPGAEIFFVTNLREKLMTYGDALTINRSDYFLLEFPADIVFPGSKEFISDLVADGFIPIIVHPEKNHTFQKNPHLLFQILQAGALSQVDADSLRGESGPDAYDTALELIKCNLVYVIASDCHSSKLRPPGLSFVYKKLSIIEKEKIDMLVETVPLAIVNNSAPPDIGPMKEPGHNKSIFDFLRGVFR